MGFYEDDRIRQKNYAANEAHALYTSYRDQMMGNGDIAAKAEQELVSNPGNRIMHEVLRLALAGIKKGS